LRGWRPGYQHNGASKPKEFFVTFIFQIMQIGGGFGGTGIVVGKKRFFQVAALHIISATAG
jgi:hypothetical protein